MRVNGMVVKASGRGAAESRHENVNWYDDRS